MEVNGVYYLLFVVGVEVKLLQICVQHVIDKPVLLLQTHIINLTSNWMWFTYYLPHNECRWVIIIWKYVL